MSKLIAKDKAISNVQIENICREHGIQLNGVVMRDELHELQIGNYIINLESSSEGSGSHWQTIVIRKDMSVFFDSFGAPPSQDIHDLIRQYFPRVYFNNFIVQDLNSSACGWYCIALLLYLKIHQDEHDLLTTKVNNFVNIFVDDTKKNFGILKRFLAQNS